MLAETRADSGVFRLLLGRVDRGGHPATLAEIVTGPGDAAEVQQLLDEASDDLADAVADLRAAGMSWVSLATAFGVTHPAVAERFGTQPRGVEVARLTRRTRRLFGFRHPRGRLTVDDRHIYYSAAPVSPKKLPHEGWRRVRSCESEVAAIRLAMYLATEVDGLRFVRRPGDFDLSMATGGE